MPRIATLTLDQINRQLDLVDNLQKQVSTLQKQVTSVGQIAVVADPTHAPATSNNLTFTWTGGTGSLSWLQGFIKTKNWSTQTLARPAAKSSAPGQQQIFAIPAGSLTLLPSSYYWLGWDVPHSQMLATKDASVLHANFNVQIICQVFTGTAGQTGTAGGGGSTGGTDLSGSRYKNF